MTKPIKTYEPYSVVVVPFPFTDKSLAKRRPALVVSSEKHQLQTDHITLLMITSAKNSAWQNDYVITSLKTAGLTAPSIIRQKIFSIDSSLVIKHIGRLSSVDINEIRKKLSEHLAIEFHHK